MSQDSIDPVKPGSIKPPEQGSESLKGTPDKNAFQKEMGTGSTPAEAGQKPEGTSPLELNQQGIAIEQPTVDSLLSQTNDTQSSLLSIKSDLNSNPNLKFKKSQEYLMKNKLADAQEHIQSAGNKLGAAMPESRPVTAGTGPVQRFVGMIEDSQNQMSAAQQEIQRIQQSGQPINSSDMMLIQVKLSQAQQELNFTSILLGKVVESFKTWMNIQI